jgi:cysteine-rich repeat protein
VSCKYFQIDGKCELCDYRIGLYENEFGTCSPICGDGIAYKPIEECDDHNRDDSDSCTNDCRIMSHKIHAYLRLLRPLSTRDNTRLAEVYFSERPERINLD